MAQINDEFSRYIDLTKKYYKYFLAIIVLFLVKMCSDEVDKQEAEYIKKDMAIGNARLVKVSPHVYKSGQYYTWEVHTGNEVFLRHVRYRPNDYLKIGMWVPVAYRNGRPYYFEILDNPYLLSLYGIPLDDSLKWVLHFRNDL